MGWGGVSKPQEYCVLIDAQGRQSTLSEFEYHQKSVSLVLNDERDDLINNFTFWHDCLPEDAKGARQQLKAVIAFIKRRKPQTDESVAWEDGIGNML